MHKEVEGETNEINKDMEYEIHLKEEMKLSDGTSTEVIKCYSWDHDCGVLSFQTHRAEQKEDEKGGLYLEGMDKWGAILFEYVKIIIPL